MISALLFICFGTPLTYCILSIPLVLLGIYIVIYCTTSLKAAELLYAKKPIKSWIAEAYEPFFHMKQPDNCWYKIVSEDELQLQEVNHEKFRRKASSLCEEYLPHTIRFMTIKNIFQNLLYLDTIGWAIMFAFVSKFNLKKK